MGYFLLNKKREVIIFAPTGFAVNDISGSTVYTTFGVNNRVGKITNAKSVRNAHISLV